VSLFVLSPAIEDRDEVEVDKEHYVSTNVVQVNCKLNFVKMLEAPIYRLSQLRLSSLITQLFSSRFL
jgi:hypothetical protein